MNKKEPIVSFLLCVYNGEKYLKQTLLSLKDMPFKEFEIIIVNDASTDCSFEIINQFKKYFKDYLVINNHKNKGLTASLNLAAKKANGLWLARIDADDVCKKNRLTEQLALGEIDKKIAVVGSSCDFINSKNKILFTRKFDNTNKKIIKSLQKVKSFFPHSSALIKKSAFMEIGGYDEFFKYAQDYDLWLRLSEKYELITSKKSLVSIRIHSERISNKSTNKEQFIFARVAIISYWLRNLYNINLTINQKKLLYKNVSKFISKNFYYQGYFCYQQIKEIFFSGKYTKLLRFYIKNQISILYFIYKALFDREYFLKKDSYSFISKN